MKHILLAASALSLLVGAGAAAAQPGPDHGRHGPPAGHMGPGPGGPGGHQNWRRGGRIDSGDWRRGRVVSNYSQYHLRRPPRGYQWRDVDGNYVLAAVAGGLIADLIAH